MARQTIAYACEHGCGRKVLTSKQAMERHDKNCFHNPDRKACITCEHFCSYHDSNGMESEPQYLHKFIVRECLASDGFDLNEKLRADCPSWMVKK